MRRILKARTSIAIRATSLLLLCCCLICNAAPCCLLRIKLHGPTVDTFVSTGGATTPVEVRRKGLRSMRRLLPRMQLAGYASAVLHPLIRVVDGPTVRFCQMILSLAN